MQHKSTQVLFNYWNEVRGDRVAPQRFDIEPSRITSILADTFILERAESNDFVYRLAGTRICEMFGFEFRGRNFLEGWSETDQITLARQLAALTAQGSVVVLEFEALNADKRPVLLEAVLLPLVHTRQSISRVLGSIVALENPAWLGSSRLETMRLVRQETIWPDGRPHIVSRALQQPRVLASAGHNVRIVRADRRSFRVYDGGLGKQDPDSR